MIAAAPRLGSIKARGEYRDAMAFADTDALRALEAITRHRPQLIVLESAFAATSRGTALINRIKADPTLAGCEIQVTTHGLQPDSAEPEPEPDPEPPVVPPAAGALPAIPEPPAPPVAATPVERPAAEAASPTAAVLDATGTRWAPRFEMKEGVEMAIDGVTAKVIDVSTSGVQLMAPTKLKPGQRVRLTFPGTSMRVSASVAWAIFEMPLGKIEYRAGMAFVDANAADVQRFIDTHKK